MPVPAKSFYPRDDKFSDSESESRWPRTDSHFQSDIVIPPSDVSEPLSAPTSGFSVPKTSSSGLKAPTKRLGVRPTLQTRFVKSLVRQQDRWQSFAPSAQEVLKNLKRSGQPLTLPSDNLNDAEKCIQWVQSHSISGSTLESSSTNVKRLVDYSPSASSLSSRSSFICKERVSKRLQLDGMDGNLAATSTPVDMPQSLIKFRKTATVLVGPQPTSDMRGLEEFFNNKAKELDIVPSGTIAVVKIQHSLVQDLSYDVEFVNVDVATRMSDMADLVFNHETVFMAQERVVDNFTRDSGLPRTAKESSLSLTPSTATPTLSEELLQKQISPTSESTESHQSCLLETADTPMPTRPEQLSTSRVSSLPLTHKESFQSLAPSIVSKELPLHQMQISPTSKSKPDSDEITPVVNTECLRRSLRTRKAISNVSSTASDDSDLFGPVDDEDDPAWAIETSSRSSEGSELEMQLSNQMDTTVTDNNDDIGNSSKKTKKEMRAERKSKRNHGKEYVTSKGVSVNARQRKPVHDCKRRLCKEIITDKVGQTLFEEYWNQGSYEKRVNYLCSRMETQKIERSRKRQLNSNRAKQVSHKYFFDINGSRHQVCKETFLSTLGETDTFLRLCAKKKSETTSGIGPSERRGKYVPKHALKEATKQSILSHIQSFPAYVSHYCRKQTKQKYLSSQLTLQKMCNMYNEEHDVKVSYSTYRRIFKTLKLKFKEPASDTCNRCDEFQAKIKFVQNEEEKKSLERDYDIHLRRAQAAYDLKTKYTQLAKTKKDICVLIFDLEQVFPTPNVSCGKAYYLRQLSTYNLTIVDAGSGKTFNCMWHEGEAARGASQIASCLFYHALNEVSDDVQEMFLFSDCYVSCIVVLSCFAENCQPHLLSAWSHSP